MYPETTSLYTATVVDSTSYRQGENDVIVVQFAGDAADKTELPRRPIPARFVVLMPPENQGSAAAAPPPSADTPSQQGGGGGGGEFLSELDDLQFMDGDYLDDIDGLDLDLGIG